MKFPMGQRFLLPDEHEGHDGFIQEITGSLIWMLIRNRRLRVAENTHTTIFCPTGHLLSSTPGPTLTIVPENLYCANNHEQAPSCGKFPTNSCPSVTGRLSPVNGSGVVPWGYLGTLVRKAWTSLPQTSKFRR